MTSARDKLEPAFYEHMRSMRGLNLRGKKGLIIGVADQHSLAYGCARIFHEAGAELAFTYHNTTTKEQVKELASAYKSTFVRQCDVQNEFQMLQLFESLKAEWGKIDFLIHSVAYAPKADLHGRVVDCSRAGFLMAMDISCHSFIRMVNLAEPLMNDGGSMLTMSYYGAEKVVPHYNLMGPVKAALESSVRYMAAELGERYIRVNAISPGAVRTRAAGGIENFDGFVNNAIEKAPMHRIVDLDDVGNLAAFLVSDLSKNITGGVHYVDAGYGVVE